MRRVPERVSDLPAHRRPRIWLGVSGADRINSQSKSFWQRRGISATCVDAVRRVQRHLSRKDRHPANPAPSSMETEHRQASAQMAAQDREGAARSATLREDRAPSTNDSNARKIRRAAAEAIRAQRLSAPDAGTVRQLDQVSRLPAPAPAQASRAGAAAGLTWPSCTK